MINSKTTGMFCAAAAMLIAGSAQAVTTATFTADNHYALYADYGGSVTLVGANESGTAGSPGTYNWSQAETFTFVTADTLYIAAWSDDATAQGLIGQFNIDGVDVFTGDAGWEVFATGIDLDDNDPAPDAALIAAQVAFADANGLWELPFVGPENSASVPNWGAISGVSSEANWVWRDSGRTESSPLQGGVNHDEFLIFRTTVPTPGAFGLLSLGVATASRRRSRA